MSEVRIKYSKTLLVFVVVTLCSLGYATYHVRTSPEKLGIGGVGIIYDCTTVDFGTINEVGHFFVAMQHIKKGKLVATAKCLKSNCDISIKVYKGKEKKAMGWGRVEFDCDGDRGKGYENGWYLILESPNCKHKCEVCVFD